MNYINKKDKEKITKLKKKNCKKKPKKKKRKTKEEIINKKFSRLSGQKGIEKKIKDKIGSMQNKGKANKVYDNIDKMYKKMRGETHNVS